MASFFQRYRRALRLAALWQFSRTQSRSPPVARCFTTAAAAKFRHRGDIFNYTSGRWLYNEKKRLAERHLAFNVPALLEAAANSINQPKDHVKSFRKLAEGGFNRVFELTMRDGLQIIARLPYPDSQPKVLATASEIATMDLVRSNGVPTPLIYEYSADADNSVGSEYIIMEKAAGRCLGVIWYELSDKERVKILGEIVDQEAKLFNISLPAYGSVYHSADLPGNMDRADLKAGTRQFCIGPDASLKYWFGTRSELDIPRGPALTSHQVLEAGAKKELAWLRTHGRARMPFDREYREMFDYQKVDPAEHVSNLENFLKAAAFTVPKEDWLHKPVIRHPDLNPNNIFVDDDCKITSIIDWQHTTNYGDPEAEELRKPEWPSNLDELDEEDRQKDIELYRRRHTHFYYVGATITKLNSHYKALSHDHGLLRKKLYQHAAEPWEGNSIPLKADLVQLAANWTEFAGSQDDQTYAPCPISFSKQEAEETMEKMLEQEDIDNKMEILRDVLGISTDGWVSADRYDDVVAEAHEMKVKALSYAESELEREMTELHWPFEDFDEDGER